jgi:hypothetical protein
LGTTFTTVITTTAPGTGRYLVSADVRLTWVGSAGQLDCAIVDGSGTPIPDTQLNQIVASTAAGNNPQASLHLGGLIDVTGTTVVGVACREPAASASGVALSGGIFLVTALPPP